LWLNSLYKVNLIKGYNMLRLQIWNYCFLQLINSLYEVNLIKGDNIFRLEILNYL